MDYLDGVDTIKAKLLGQVMKANFEIWKYFDSWFIDLVPKLWNKFMWHLGHTAAKLVFQCYQLFEDI